MLFYPLMISLLTIDFEQCPNFGGGGVWKRLIIFAWTKQGNRRKIVPHRNDRGPMTLYNFENLFLLLEILKNPIATPCLRFPFLSLLVIISEKFFWWFDKKSNKRMKCLATFLKSRKIQFDKRTKFDFRTKSIE